MQFYRIIFISILSVYSLAFGDLSSEQQSFVQALELKKKQQIDLSPTEALFLKYALNKQDSCYWFEHQLDWNQLVTKVASIEKQAKQDGFVTLVHARQWGWNFLNDIWNMIVAVTGHQATMSDRISLRQRNLFTVDTKKLQKLRKQIIQDGVYCDSATQANGAGAELTFMNRTFFSSYDDWYTGECTGEYFLHNYSIATSDYPLWYAIELLSQYGLNGYEDRVEKLYRLHKQASEYGELLCISVKKSLLNSMVYAAHPFGYKNMDCKNTLKRIQNRETSVLKDDANYDNDCSLYCLAVSDIPGEYGTSYRIDSVHMSNDNQYQAYKKELHKLFKKIKKLYIGS